MGDPEASYEFALEELLFRYVESLDGLVLFWTKCQRQAGREAAPISLGADVVCHVCVKLVLLRAKAAALVGSVHALSPNHVSLKVLHCFFGSVRAEALMERGYVFHKGSEGHDGDEWRGDDAAIRVGDTLRVLVESVDQPPYDRAFLYAGLVKKKRRRHSAPPAVDGAPPERPPEKPKRRRLSDPLPESVIASPPKKKRKP